MVTIIAAILVIGGIVIGVVLVGVIYEVMSNPAVILPSARRVRGCVIAWLFSFIIKVVLMRVCPVCTSIAIRVL